jgi:hypothetical protein
LNDPPQPRHADLVRPDVVALNMHTAQGQRPVFERDLRHDQDGPDARCDPGDDDRFIRLLANDLDRHRHPAAHHIRKLRIDQSPLLSSL